MELKKRRERGRAQRREAKGGCFRAFEQMKMYRLKINAAATYAKQRTQDFSAAQGRRNETKQSSLSSFSFSFVLVAPKCACELACIRKRERSSRRTRSLVSSSSGDNSSSSSGSSGSTLKKEREKRGKERSALALKGREGGKRDERTSGAV